MPETFAQPDDLGELRASELHTSIGERLGAQAGEAFMGGSRTLLRAGQYALAEKGVDTFEPDEFGGGRFVATRDHPDLPIADAKARVQQEGLEHHFKLPDQPTIKQGVLDLMVQHAHERRQYEAAVSRGPQGILPGALGFVTELGAGIIDPVNIAAFSIPVVGEARMGMMLAGAGTSMLARAGIKAGVGAAQGAVGGALLAPADWWLHTRDGVDYTMTDALHSIVLSAGMGAAFHSGFGFLGDLRSRYRGMPMAGTPEDLRVRALMGDTRAADVVERGALTGDRTAPPFEDVPGIAPEGMSREQAHLAVYDDAISQLKAAGMADEEAAHNAAIVAARYATRAERLGGAENALDLYRNEGLSIRRGEGEAGGEAEGRSFDQQPAFAAGKQAVTAFMDGDRTNAWVDVPEGRMYLRQMRRPRLGNVLDVSNLNFETRGTGAFTAYLDHIEQRVLADGKFEGVYVENIFNKRLIPFLERRGYVKEGGSGDPPSMLMPKSRLELLERSSRPAEQPVPEGGGWLSKLKRSFFQSRPTAPTFFSAVQRTVETGKLTKGSPDQWLATIKNTPGVKAEELEWLGLADWLKQQKGSVTKEQVTEYVRANQIEVKEVTKGREGADRVPQIDPSLLEHYAHQFYGRNYETLTAAEQERVVNEGVRPEPIRAVDETKFSGYQLPGGEKYRELLLTLPEGRAKETAERTFQEYRSQLIAKYGENFSSASPRPEWERYLSLLGARDQAVRSPGPAYRGGHWEEPNVLAHMRFNDRTIDGKRTLMIEEIQSDWHQQGRTKGYGEPPPTDTRGWTATLETRTREWGAIGDYETFVVRDKDGNILSNQDGVQSAEEAIRAAARREELSRQPGVPDAPFKTTWPELSLKRLIRYAAENGYDQVAWTPGHVQAERYDLSKQISRIVLHDNSSGGVGHPRMEGPFENGNVIAFDHSGREVINKRVTPEQLPDVIGKEVADKLLNAEPKRSSYAGLGVRARSLEGLDLKVGGEGMSGFYDKILPAAANKLVKKYGTRVGEAELAAPTDAAVRADLEMVRRGPRFDVVEAEDGILVESFGTAEEANRFIDSEASKAAEKPGITVHTLPITPELRDAAVSQGFPLFQRDGEGGPRGRIDLQHNKAVITLFAKADKSTFMHEAGHLWLDELVRDARRENVPQALKDDLGTVLRWLGVDKAEDIQTEQHEKWARGFEAYLAEGSAPSTALAKAFEAFKQWLKAIYHSLTQLDAPLNNDIRGVMDRMLATDGELLARPRPAEILADLPARVREDVQRAATADVINGNAVRAGELLEEAAKEDPRIAESVRGEGNAAPQARISPELPAGESSARPVSGEGPAGITQQRPAAEAGQGGKADWQRVADAKRGDDAELITASNEAKAEPEPESLDPKKSISAAEKAAAEADQLLADILPSLTEDERTLFEDMLNKAAADKTAQEDIIRQGAACLLAAAI